jgi:hypothetical protein
MKKYLFIILFGIATFSFTGCYTQLVVEEDDDYYVYHEPVPVVIYYPVPLPVYNPAPPPNPPQQPVYKTRKPVPPPSNVRERDDIRNSGGRNEGKNRSRR